MNTISVIMHVLQDNLDYLGTTVLSYRIEYPSFHSVNYADSLTRVNEYYSAKALEMQKYCENELYGYAKDQFRVSVESGFPVREFQAVSVFKVTYNKECAFSLYTDRYEYTGGAHGSTVRSSETWGMNSRGMLRLSELYKCTPLYREAVVGWITRQIKENEQDYFEDYKELVRKHFNARSFYCTDTGIVVYFQQYEIAPYAGGIKEFLLPYSNCVLQPSEMCKK